MPPCCISFAGAAPCATAGRSCHNTLCRAGVYVLPGVGHGPAELGAHGTEPDRANEDAMAQLRQGFADLLATGAGIRETYYRALLAEAAGSRGKSEAGQQLLAEALAAVQRTEERYWEAELYRLQGDLLGQDAERPRRGGAEANFLRALGWLAVSNPNLWDYARR